MVLLNYGLINYGLTKCLELWICRDSEYTRILNMQSVQNVLCKFFDRYFRNLNKLQIVNMNSDF